MSTKVLNATDNKYLDSIGKVHLKRNSFVERGPPQAEPAVAYPIHEINWMLSA